MKKFLQSVSAIFILVVFCFTFSACRHPTKEVATVKATVTEKRYVGPRTKYGYYYDFFKCRYRWMFRDFPEEYNITFQYKDLTETCDRQDLFKSVEVGDNIDVKLTSYFDNDGNLLSRYISPD